MDFTDGAHCQFTPNLNWIQVECLNKRIVSILTVLMFCLVGILMGILHLFTYSRFNQY